MKDGVKLNDVLDFYQTMELKKDLVYRIDSAMKELHQHGGYITGFQLNQIVEFPNRQIRFMQAGTLLSNNFKTEISRNIYSLAFLEIGIYLGHPENLNYNFLKENLEEVLPYVPSEDADYYRAVIQKGEVKYLSDYSTMKKSEDANPLSQTSQRVKTKSTPVGRSFSESTNLNSSAYINIVVLTAFVICTVLIVSIIFMLYYLR